MQNTHDKSQSANNLATFADSMQLTVSEPNALNQLSETKGFVAPASASSSYFPLEPTMEECLDSLDISYDATESANNSHRKIDAFSENEEDSVKTKDYLFDESDLFTNLFSKNSSEIDLFLNTLNAFTQKKSKLVELLKSLSAVKAPKDESKGSGDELNQVWSSLLSQMGDDSDKVDLKTNDNATDNNQLSTMLQRCQSSMDGVLEQQIDAAAMLQEIDDEEEIIRDSAIADENETDENIDEEFMEDELENEKNSHEVNFDAGLQRMRELKRRHVTQNYKTNEDPSETVQQMLSNHNHHYDEFVLKCQFSALIPAFDPRPGKNNINQIQDISVPAQTSVPNEPVEAENKASKLF